MMSRKRLPIDTQLPPSKTQNQRTREYLTRLRKAGGTIVAVRMTKSQLAALDALRMPKTESRSACVNRLVNDRQFQRQMNTNRRAIDPD